jgi:fibro-slime domain-containing protein
MKRASYRRAVVTAAAGLAFISASAFAATLTLTGTIRDFANPAGGTLGLSAHPDFEAFIGGPQTGMVASTLDAQGKPVFIGAPGFGSVSSAASFAQWYRDTPGVNASKQFSITLNGPDAPGSILTYSNSSFFPIDNDLNGNQGRDHNFHFTYELAGTFGYQAGTGQSFSFTGDDDVWVFLNGQLAIDLGGIHGAVSATVDLDTAAPSLGLQDGQNYAFNMFFAERHTSASNFRIDTSLPVQTIPEPSTWFMSVSGLLLAAGMRWKRRKPA